MVWWQQGRLWLLLKIASPGSAGRGDEQQEGLLEHFCDFVPPSPSWVDLGQPRLFGSCRQASNSLIWISWQQLEQGPLVETRMGCCHPRRGEARKAAASQRRKSAKSSAGRRKIGKDWTCESYFQVCTEKKIKMPAECLEISWCRSYVLWRSSSHWIWRFIEMTRCKSWRNWMQNLQEKDLREAEVLAQKMYKTLWHSLSNLQRIHQKWTATMYAWLCMTLCIWHYMTMYMDDSRFG